MNVAVKGGIVLGVAVALYSMINGFSGFYKSPSSDLAFIIVASLIELGVIIWILRQTAAVKRYGGQLATGMLVAIVGAVIVFGASLLFTSMFPDYQEFALANASDSLRDSGASDAQIEQQMAVVEVMVRPLPSAIVGSVMTIVTGLVLSLIVAAFVRKKD